MNLPKNLEQIVTVTYLHFSLFRMHERVIATEIKLDLLIQMAVELNLAQKFKENATRIAQVTIINKYVSVNTGEQGNSSVRMP